MIDHINFLQEARRLLIDIMQGRIIQDELDESLSQLKIMLDSGVVIYQIQSIWRVWISNYEFT